jgi:hypothetical protein
MADAGEKLRIDAGTFQEPLWKLAEVMAQKVNREGPQYLRAPAHVSADLFMMIRHSIATYNMLFYLNADQRRDEDCFWNNNYGVVTAQVVRSMIDCLYNITSIMENPAVNGTAYRKSGLKNRLRDIEADEEKYGGRPEWDDFNRERRKNLGALIRRGGLTEAEVAVAGSWPTLGTYLNPKKGGMLTPHQRFLKTFTYHHWRQYSALAHGGLEGYIGDPPLGAYFIIDTLPHEDRPKFDAQYPEFISRHVGRAAAVLLCLITEIQAYFRFEGADINNRIVSMWNALMGFFEAKELYDERYEQLMRDRRILR